jgi:uncharacterized protein
MPKKKIVFDTNVIVSAVCFPNGKADIVFRVALNKDLVLISQPLCDEIENVLQRKKLDKYISIEKRNQFFLNFINKYALWINPVEKIDACRDPKDNMILELAVAGKADFIITGDKDLKVLNPFQQIQIISPAEFLHLNIPSNH